MAWKELYARRNALIPGECTGKAYITTAEEMHYVRDSADNAHYVDKAGENTHVPGDVYEPYKAYHI